MKDKASQSLDPQAFFDSLKPEVRGQLEDLDRVARWRANGERIWERVLTDGERDEFGNDFRQTFCMFGTLRMLATARGWPQLRTIVEFGRMINRIDEATYRWLLREIGEDETNETSVAAVPSWSCETRELRFRNRVVKTISRSPKIAKNIVPVLEAFQEEGWPPRIDDPLPNGADSARLHETIKSLNSGR